MAWNPQLKSTIQHETNRFLKLNIYGNRGSSAPQSWLEEGHLQSGPPSHANGFCQFPQTPTDKNTYTHWYTLNDTQTQIDRHTKTDTQKGHSTFGQYLYQKYTFNLGLPPTHENPFCQFPHMPTDKNTYNQRFVHIEMHTNTPKQKELSRFSIDETHPSFCLTDKLPA